MILKSHPRYHSLVYRETLIKGVKAGLVSFAGLTAHGRGEAFDYLIGEKTEVFARDAIRASAAVLLVSTHPVMSINGNTAALVSDEMIQLANTLKAPIEINLFHRTRRREKAIASYLKKKGASRILLPDSTVLPDVASLRCMISREGQEKADVVFVPLEDGDRTAALMKMGKKVITIDLNPLSRTARHATITIVDHISRALPLLINDIRTLRAESKENLIDLVHSYQNSTTLSLAYTHIKNRLDGMIG